MESHDKMVVDRNPSLKPYCEHLSDASEKFRIYAKRCIHSKNAVIFLAENKDGILGYCLCIIKKNIPIFKVKLLGHIRDLYVEKKYRNQGISSMLINEALEWFKSKNIKHTSIMVSPENPKAHKIYGKWGFNDYHMEMRKKI